MCTTGVQMQIAPLLIKTTSCGSRPTHQSGLAQILRRLGIELPEPEEGNVLKILQHAELLRRRHSCVFQSQEGARSVVKNVASFATKSVFYFT